LLKNKPKVTVLLATFNGEMHLDEQLKSIENQLVPNISILVSDDCSSDATLQIINAACVENQNIRLLPNQPLGSASANFFRLIRDVDLSCVDYIALSDQDDIWQPAKLSRAVQVIAENDVDAYSSNVTAFWPNGTQRLINKAQSQQLWDYMFESAGPGCTFVLNRNMALDLQGFLNTNQDKCQGIALHDWFIYAFARSRGFKWLIDPESHMLYRQHAGNVVGANVGLRAKLSRWKKLRESWLMNQALLIANLLGYVDALPMVKLQRYNFSDRLVLIVNIKKLRRRMRDRVALVLFLLWPLKK
jgi:rhamnosyltransferase